ncbi:MAG: hypothetical protein LRY51_08550 [Geovibrio sp.]|nr:hypothetical protein [Geovibrio sp.]
MWSIPVIFAFGGALFDIGCGCAYSAAYFEYGGWFQHRCQKAEKLPCFRFHGRDIVFFGIVVHVFIFRPYGGAYVFENTGD